jgi:uncharacterized protein (TIGR02722 family)
MKKIFLVLLTALMLITAIFALTSCKTKVRRVDADKQIDLSGYWNDTDVRIVCEALIRDCINNPRVDQAIRAKGSIPVVIVGRFRNESSEQINTAIISSTMETAIFNSGKLDFVAGGSVRDEVRAEREDQQHNVSAQTMARLRIETGADFFMTGTVRSMVDTDRNRSVRTYYVTAELINIETNQRIWMGENSEIKKMVRRPRFSP